MRLHQRGIDLLLDVQHVMQHLNRLSTSEVKDLLKEIETVMRDLLARDFPDPDNK